MPTFVSVVFYIFRGDVVFGGFTVLVGSIEKHPVTCICWTNECSYSYCSLNSTCWFLTALFCTFICADHRSSSGSGPLCTNASSSSLGIGSKHPFSCILHWSKSSAPTSTPCASTGSFAGLLCNFIIWNRDSSTVDQLLGDFHGVLLLCNWHCFPGGNHQQHYFPNCILFSSILQTKVRVHLEFWLWDLYMQIKHYHWSSWATYAFWLVLMNAICNGGFGKQLLWSLTSPSMLNHTSVTQPWPMCSKLHWCLFVCKHKGSKC